MLVEPADQSHHSGSTRKSVSLEDRVLIEAVSALERLNSAATTDPLAEQIGRSTQGELERKMAMYAKALPASSNLQDALRHTRHAITLMIVTAAVTGAIGGVAASRAALSTQHDEPVNFYWALGASLGIQTLFLCAWIAMMVISRRPAPSVAWFATVGGIVLRAAEFVTSKAYKGPEHAAAITATSAVHLRGPIGKWTISCISHGIWLVFNVTCLMTLIVALSARKYSFAWETTILSESQYIPLTKAVAALPRALGFNAPTDEQIAASQWRGVRHIDSASDQAWSGLLIGSVVLYGFGPRLLLFAFSLGRRRFLAQAFRINANDAKYARIRAVLYPSATNIRVVDPDLHEDQIVVPNVRSAPESRPLGPPAILGFELSAKPGTIWPPPLHQVRWLDLGMVDSREDQRRVISTLRNNSTEPETVAVVISLTATPDRGSAAFLRELSGSVARPLTVVLTSGESLRARSSTEKAQQRIGDWRILAEDVGIPRSSVIDVDLDHFTQSSAAKLSAAVTSQSHAHHSLIRHLEEAFELISNHAQRWSLKGIPSDNDQAELHRAIARLYHHDGSRWNELFAAARSISASAARVDVAALKSSADRVLSLLPPRLRSSPRWIAVGAATGALGCIAVASLVSPAAIAALPMWTTFGGSISGLIALTRSQATPEQSAENTEVSDKVTAVRSAALFAMLLELQGRDENVITRVLDNAIADDQDEFEFEATPEWLNRLRHRFDMALAREMRT